MAFRAERIFVLTTILLIGLGLTLAVSRGMLGAETDGNAALLWTLTFALIVVAAGGSLWLRSGSQLLSMTSGGQAIGASPPRQFARTAGRMSTLGEVVVPALLVAGFTLFIQLFASGVLQALILIVAAFALAAVFWAQVHGVDMRDRYFGLAQAMLNVLSHLCAFLLFATIYGLKTRSIISGSAVALVAFLLIHELLSRDAAWHRAMDHQVEIRQLSLWLLAAACAAVLGELTWGLNYWAALTTLVGGAFLLVDFYVAYGLLSHYLDRTLNRQTIFEFGTVGLVATLAIFVSAFIMR